MSHETFFELTIRELQRLKSLAERALAQVDGEQFFTPWQGGEDSLATLVKHLAGNMRSRWTDFLTSDGEKPDRNRDSEFVIASGDTRDALMERWEHGWGLVVTALEPLGDGDLDRVVTIRGEPHSAAQAASRQLSHYAYHVGQIVLLAKHHAGDSWESLSIPRGESERFNQSPTQYR